MSRLVVYIKGLTFSALACILAAPFLQPAAAHAQPMLNVVEMVRDVTLGQPYSTNTYTYAGDQLALRISITNSGNQPATGLTVTANVHEHEDFITGSCTPACTYNPTAMTVTFDLSSMPLAPGTGITTGFSVTTDPAAPVGHVHYNMATAMASGVSATSNTATTTVVAPGTSPCVATSYSACVPSPCGTTGYTACAPAYPCAGYPTCAQVFAFPVICGTVTFFQAATATATGVITMNGTTYVVAAGTAFPASVIVVGGFFCFMMSQSAVITGYLSTVPTVATAQDDSGRIYRMGLRRVE